MEDGAPVDEQLDAPDLHPPEADPALDPLGDGAVRRDQADLEPVQRRHLRRPRADVRHLGRQAHAADPGGADDGLGLAPAGDVVGPVSAPAALRLWRSTTPRRGGPGRTNRPVCRAVAGRRARRRPSAPVRPRPRPRPASPAPDGCRASRGPTSSDSVPVVPSAVSPVSTTRSARYVEPVAYRNTGRVMPPCHHWSWSSMNEASDHFTTVSRSSFAPGPQQVGDLELGREMRVLADPDVLPVDLDQQHALGRPDVEHHPLARPARRGPRTTARRRRSGSPRASRAGDWGTASGRWCRSAGPTCPAWSSSRGRRPRPTRRRAPRRGGAAAGTAIGRRAGAGRRGGRRASAGVRWTSTRDQPRAGAS